MKYLQPVSPARTSAGKIASRGPQADASQADAPAPQVDIIDGEVVEEVHQSEPTQPVDPPVNPQPDPRPRETANDWFRSLRGYLPWGIALAAVLLLLITVPFSGDDEEEKKEPAKAEVTIPTTFPATIEFGTVFTGPIEVPLDKGLRWAAVDRTKRFQVATPDLKFTCNYPTSDGEKCNLPNGGEVVIRSLESEPVKVRLTLVDLQ